jgi:ureidoglycolate hydrolase
MTDIVIRTLPLPAQPATPAALAPYGTLIEPGIDGTPFGAADARLELGRGTPRLYIMKLQHRPLHVAGITRHAAVTQCLAAMGGKEWLIALAPPGDPDDPAGEPDPERIEAFRIPGHKALALHRGTWHAGPFLLEPEVDFVNLELSDTNIVDHHTVRLDQRFGVAFEIVP